MHLTEDEFCPDIMSLLAQFDEDIQIDREDDVEEMEMLFDDTWGG